jgi:hypothetical protein
MPTSPTTTKQDQTIQPLLRAITTHFGLPFTPELPYCFIKFAPYTSSPTSMRLNHFPRISQIWVAIVGDQYYCTVVQVTQQGSTRYYVQ